VQFPSQLLSAEDRRLSVAMDGSVAAVAIGGSVIEARNDQIIIEESSVILAPAGGSSSHDGCSHGDHEEKLEVADVATAPALPLPPLVGGHTGAPLDPDVCAICLDKIKLAETSQIKGCEHSYCVTCILRWAMYQKNTWCPQCRLPFTELYVYRALDGCLNDYLFEESVCLLLRASWFKGMPALPVEKEEVEDYYEDDDFDDYYFKSNVRIGNRRWGDNGYVRAGRREARPVGVRHLAAAVAQADEAGSSSFRPGKAAAAAAKEKAPAQAATGRRAKRAQKRAANDKQAAH
jgi:hypothetical protein